MENTPSRGEAVRCSAAEIAKRAKKRYSVPILHIYGSVRQITLGATGTIFDGQSGKARPSDRSIKENVRRVGTHPLGVGLYLFDYKPGYCEEAGQGRHFGVMADEVESVLPRAVGRHARGHKTVDYAMLGISVPEPFRADSTVKLQSRTI